MSRLLVFGHSGFVGTHVQEAARSRSGIEVAVPPSDLDIRDARAVNDVICNAEPDWILHLAGQSSVADSLRHPIETYSVNTIGTANVVSSAVASGFKGRMLFVSSADVYGLVESAALPIAESQPAAPRSPYAA
ncbi:MAG: GDP-mannose 4,6-dehydratase, partial [Burkholderiaceae bacterium]|nr:GDP-mannose 4,6-dehydratase [Burkholderiaceae bacterium]